MFTLVFQIPYSAAIYCVYAFSEVTDMQHSLIRIEYTTCTLNIYRLYYSNRTMPYDLKHHLIPHLQKVAIHVYIDIGWMEYQACYMYYDT